MEHKKFVTKRHRPSVWAYFRQVWRASSAFSERLEGMVSIFYLAISSTLAIVASFTAQNIWVDFESWYLQVGVGVVVFILVQFVVLTPIRMWRDAVWVVNVEKALDGLWDLHDEGVGLLTAHTKFQDDTPNWKVDIKATNQWVEGWATREKNWELKVDKALTAFAPVEARRLRNVVAIQYLLTGISEKHTHRSNALREKLDRFGKMIERHHPALLPE